MRIADRRAGSVGRARPLPEGVLPHYVTRLGLFIRYAGGVASPPLTTCRALVVCAIWREAKSRAIGKTQTARKRLHGLPAVPGLCFSRFVMAPADLCATSYILHRSECSLIALP